RALAADRSLLVVWENEAGGVTFSVGDEAEGGAPELYVKWAPAGSEHDFAGEAARLTWAAPYTVVPEVLELGRDAGCSWLVTRALAGKSTVDPYWRGRPELTVRAIGEGLRAWHHALPVDACPFSWDAATRLAAAFRRAATGRQDASAWHREHSQLSVEEALERASMPPPVDRLVVCHGDTCPPNTLLDESGRCCGHVDVGRLGVADRWADLAIATWSCEWNWGPGWGATLLEAYGVPADPERMAYYRLLWDLA
ncbi:MAG TPA: aminoglycoside 3'-phosphotransferase, partial [Acidimicrobiales bacterium]|nr:aminoglycoside 3'-phosphotransferase [Acidimicrobiales bacterium]